MPGGWGTDPARGWGFAVDLLPCAAGDDLGTFEFGSTVVLLIGGPKAQTGRLGARKAT